MRGIGPTHEAAFEQAALALMHAIGDPARIGAPRMVEIACEAPGAYKDVGGVVAVAERAGLARPVARLRPLISIKE